jgi:hypothetical protein
MQNSSPDVSGTAAAPGERRRGELAAVLVVWLALAAILVGLGGENTFLPGLYYDEAVFGGLAKDFVNGPAPGRHMPNTAVVQIFGRPFPVFVQSYLGAVKSWLLIPPVALFGPSVPVLRLANLAWGAAGLLFFMLWSWRVAGLAVALAAGALLALDPAFFFTSILDWGSVGPSLFCRFAGFFFAVRAWEKGKARDALLAGLCLGLGLFNKIDFAVLLLGVALGALAVLARPLAAFAVRRPILVGWGALGFLIGGGLMLLHLPKILTHHAPAGPGELHEKLRILQMMWDGSYFCRLLAAGGRFETLSATPSAAWTPFALVLAASAVVLAGGLFRRGGDKAAARLSLFLLLTLLFVTAGLLLLPGAVRLHHALLVLPFPHLIIATALVGGWKRWAGGRRAAPVGRALLAASFALLLGWQTEAILQTQRLIRETGGRGCWSEAMVQFCREVKNRSDLTIISLDWGFNEQLLFLTDGPRLEEPIWNWVFNQAGADRSKPPADPNLVYLFHPDQYSKFNFGSEFARLAPPPGHRLSIQTWRDAQGQPAFYSARFVKNEPAP